MRSATATHYYFYFTTLQGIFAEHTSHICKFLKAHERNKYPDILSCKRGPHIGTLHSLNYRACSQGCNTPLSFIKHFPLLSSIEVVS